MSDSGQNLKMIKTSLFCSIHQENTCKSSFHSNVIILTDFHSFKVNEGKLKICQFSSFLLRSTIFSIQSLYKGIRLWSKFKDDENFLTLFYSSRKHLEIIFTFEFDHLHWLSQFYSEWREALKLVNWIFLLRSRYTILVKIWKWLKLLNSVSFIKKTLVNQVSIRISSFWLTFTVFQWMKENSKTSQF